MQLRFPSSPVTLIKLKAQLNIILTPTSAINCWSSMPVARWPAFWYLICCRMQGGLTMLEGGVIEVVMLLN